MSNVISLDEPNTGIEIDLEIDPKSEDRFYFALSYQVPALDVGQKFDYHFSREQLIKIQDSIEQALKAFE